MSETTGLQRLRETLGHEDFRRFAFSRFFATVALQAISVAVGWQIYTITRDPLDLGLIGLAQFLPFFALVLPAGQLADRADRRAIILAAYLIEALAVVLLIGFTISGASSVWPAFLAMALIGVGRALWMPASQAMTINLVPQKVFPTAVAFNSSMFEIAVIMGPAFGGFVYALGDSARAGSTSGSGALWVYGIGLGVLLLVMSMMWRVRPVRPPPNATPLHRREFFEGLRFVFGRRPVLGAISLDLFAVFFGGVTALLPMYAADILQVGPEGLGLLRTAPGVGAAITAVLLARRPITRHAGAWMFGGVAVFGAATVLFGLSTSFWLSCVALAFAGAGDMVSVFVRHLLVQLETPDAIRGRVSAVSAMFIGASNELGEFESGLTASWWGTVPAATIGGLACLGVVGVYLKLFPELRKLDRFAEPPPS